MSMQVVTKEPAGQTDHLRLIEDRLYESGYRHIVGVDEAGRGPLAGPVVAAAVILPEDLELEGLDDSKKLTPTRRDLIFDRIVTSAAVFGVGIVDNEMIDRINILRASLQAMTIAVGKLAQTPDFVLVDGRFTVPGLNLPQMAVVGGDARCRSVAAASILAKVTRDRIMDHYAQLYPLYTFGRHKGYPTPEHLKELRLYGPTLIHRKSFRPVQLAVAQVDLQLA